VNAIVNRDVKFIDLGLVEYKQAWDFQTRLFEETIGIKNTNRHLPASEQEVTPNHLIFCEHPHVYTLGKSGKESNLLIPPHELDKIQATYFHINRGGDITYHGPGQLVVYPILDLDNFFTDIHRFMRAMEDAVISTLSEFGIKAGRFTKLTGVWIDEHDPDKARKICAMGVKMSRWVTMHGLALNVNPNLKYFKHIVPCGIDDKSVTSIEKELSHPVDMESIKQRLKKEFERVFEMSLIENNVTA
jgi:lipoyl(octanoyl) transferase